MVFVDVRRPSYFNPRPPRGERQQLQSYARTAKLFQSTPSARRATAVLIVYICVFVDFNPRPPRGGRPGRQNHTTRKDDISIHALREEGDPGDKITRLERMIFQSTPSARRATNIVCAVGGGLLHFNPRPPWGKRPDKPKTPAPAKQFQSAISTWKATTDKLIVYDEAYMISIHALREEGDRRLHR